MDVPLVLSYSVCQEQVSAFCPCSRGRDGTRTGILGSREHWGHLTSHQPLRILQILHSNYLNSPLPNQCKEDIHGARLVLRMGKLTSPSSNPSPQPLSSSGLAGPGGGGSVPHLKPSLHKGESPETFFLSPLSRFPQKVKTFYREIWHILRFVVGHWVRRGLGTAITSPRWHP